MTIRTIYYSSHFSLAFRKLPSVVQDEAVHKERLFRKNCFDPRLKTHKLKGKLNGHWSFSVNYSYRILFTFQDDGSVILIDIGSHSIYG